MINTGRIKKLLDEIRDKKNISVFCMPFYSRLLALSNLTEGFLYVCPDYVKAAEAFEQIKSLRGDAVYLPPLDDVLSTARQSRDTSLKRLRAMYGIATGKAKIAVTTVLAYMQLYPSKKDFLNAAIQLKKGQSYDIDGLITRLSAHGYKRVTQVDSLGQFAVRGDIFDISPVNLEFGVRIDFFGDGIERVRLMDFDSQLSEGEIEQVEICPNTEVFLNGNDITATLKPAIPKGLEPQYLTRIKSVAEELTQKAQAKISDGSLNCLKPVLNQISLHEFFDGVVVFDEQKQCVDNYNAHLSEHKSRFKTLLARGEAFEFELNSLTDKLITKNHSLLSFDKLLCQNRIFNPQIVLEIKDPELPSYAKNKESFVDDIKMWRQRGINIEIYVDGVLKQSIADLLSENGVSMSVVKDGLLYRGGCFLDEKRILIGRGDLTSKRRGDAPKSKKAAFFQPKAGEHVVHEIHGIGLCEGLKRMNMGGAERDYVVIDYDGGAKLYLAVENMNLLSAYAGEDEPKLNKIGGAEFLRLKEKVKKAIKEMAFDLTKLYADRENSHGRKYSPSRAALSEFEADFPYEETPDQLTAVEEGLKDLTTGKIMDRLLCGDVGYGKTEVAMRLAYKAVLEGYQAAFVSPTTILARQHFETLKKRMGKFGVNIASLTRFDSPQEIKNALEGISKGTVDIICGTHRALSKDVFFKDLGLLILDEEQRFGVADKEKIKLLKTDVNVLSLSATPIPRTLHMAMSGIRDISVLTTPPPSRIPVSTYVCEYTDSLVLDAVNREINRGGQVFIVFNRVEKIDAYASTIANMFPDLKVAVAHGQLPENQLEERILKFISGQTDILVTSTIIENGIDMQNVNTMIVVDADRLGLSQLYQLRGRIGRSDRLAYAFFTFDGSKILTENAYKRLDAIAGYTELGSGFKLAMRDLEIRGAGNILGREQHGHMQKVGYDMYLKLISEVMNEISGKQTAEVKEVKVVADFPAFIPEDYIPDIDWRLKAYKRIAELDSQDAGHKELAELRDVYGAPPQSIKNLVLIAVLKNLAQRLNAEKITLTRQACAVKFISESAIPLDILKDAVARGFTYSAADAAITAKAKPDSPQKLMNFLVFNQKT